MVPLIFIIPGLAGEDGLIRKNTVRFKRAAGCAFLGIPPQGPLFFILSVSFLVCVCGARVPNFCSVYVRFTDFGFSQDLLDVRNWEVMGKSRLVLRRISSDCGALGGDLQEWHLILDNRWQWINGRKIHDMSLRASTRWALWNHPRFRRGEWGESQLYIPRSAIRWFGGMDIFLPTFELWWIKKSWKSGFFDERFRL